MPIGCIKRGHGTLILHWKKETAAAYCAALWGERSESCISVIRAGIVFFLLAMSGISFAFSMSEPS